MARDGFIPYRQRVRDDEAPVLWIERLRPERDLEQAQRIMEAAGDYLEFEHGKPVTTALVRELLEARGPRSALEDKFTAAIVDDGGEAMGLVDMLQHHPEQGDWYLGLLLLLPAARGRDIGRRVLRWVERHAGEWMSTRLFVCPLEGNARARRFYAREGFAVHREIPPMPIGEAVHARVEMLKSLPPLPHHCPSCGVDLPRNMRYPSYLCRDCSVDPRDAEGRPLDFSNADPMGGFKAARRDSGEPYAGHECFCKGLRCFAQEARFGGIAFQHWPEGETPPGPFPPEELLR